MDIGTGSAGLQRQYFSFCTKTGLRLNDSRPVLPRRIISSYPLTPHIHPLSVLLLPFDSRLTNWSQRVTGSLFVTCGGSGSSVTGVQKFALQMAGRGASGGKDMPTVKWSQLLLHTPSPLKVLQGERQKHGESAEQLPQTGNSPEPSFYSSIVRWIFHYRP